MAELSFKTLASELNMPEATIRKIAEQAEGDEQTIRDVAAFMTEKQIADPVAAIAQMPQSQPQFKDIPFTQSPDKVEGDLDTALAVIDQYIASDESELTLVEQFHAGVNKFLSIHDERQREAWLQSVQPEELQHRIRQSAFLQLRREALRDRNSLFQLTAARRTSVVPVELMLPDTSIVEVKQLAGTV